MAVDIGVPFHKGAGEVLQGSGRDVAVQSSRNDIGGAAQGRLTGAQHPGRLRHVSEAAPPVIVSDEKLATTPRSVALRSLINAVAIAMSLYHMYVAAFGPPEAIIFRGTHLLFALTLVFLLYPLKPRGAPAWRSVDLLLLARSATASCCTSSLNYEYFINRIIYIDDLTIADKFYAVVAVVIVLEATRRVIGWRAAADRAGVPGLRDRLHDVRSAGADGAALFLDRRHLRRRRSACRRAT